MAKRLGICVTVLKARCREFGIHRWPYRKVKKLDNLISTLEGNRADLKGDARESKERQLRSVRETKRFLLHNPNSTAHLKLGKVKSLKSKSGVRGSSRRGPAPPGGARSLSALAATGGKLEAALPQHLPISGASAFSPLILRGAAEASSSERSNDTAAAVAPHPGSPHAAGAMAQAPLVAPSWGYHPAMMQAMMPWIQASTMMMPPGPVRFPVGVAYPPGMPAMPFQPAAPTAPPATSPK